MCEHFAVLVAKVPVAATRAVVQLVANWEAFSTLMLSLLTPHSNNGHHGGKKWGETIEVIVTMIVVVLVEAAAQPYRNEP